MVTISPWPLEAGEEEAPEQRGSAQMLLRAPGTLRCGISGMLMMDPVYIPGSQVAHYPVAFSRRSLEKWHRRSKGRCPITGDTLDLKESHLFFRGTGCFFSLFCGAHPPICSKGPSF
ncbi:unnamed protein product [Effrenium voratum]|nr:unnamed protein product [Effrenium voratum]